jgi:hypothetical protein
MSEWARLRDSGVEVLAERRKLSRVGRTGRQARPAPASRSSADSEQARFGPGSRRGCSCFAKSQLGRKP